MFALGATESEIHRCLMRKRPLLIQHGAKADNIPSKAEKRAEFISGLSNSAMVVVLDWFSEHAEFSDLLDPEEAIRQLSLNSNTENVDDIGYRKLWRAILAGYAGQLHRKTVENFLAGEPRHLIKSKSISKSVYSESISEVEANYFLSLATGTALPRPPEVVPGFANGVVAALCGDIDGIESSRDRLLGVQTPSALKLVDVLDALAKKQNASRFSDKSICTPLSIGDIKLDDISCVIVLGARKNQLPSGQFFIHIHGIVHGDDLIALSYEDSRDLFPETGDATAFPGTVNNPQNAMNSLAVWRIELQSPDKKVHYVVKSFVTNVYDLVEVPHPSSEPDKVRAWIKGSYMHNPSVFPVFRLADGPIVKFHNDDTNVNEADFESPLNGYYSHSFVAWHKRIISFKPFSTPDFKFDCSPLGKLVKRIFKANGELSQIPKLTNRQLNELVDWMLKEGSDMPLRRSVERARSQMIDLFQTKEHVEDVLQDILVLPQVKEAVDVEVKRKVSMINQEIQIAKSQLSELEMEKKRLNLEINDLRQKNKKESVALSREIKKTFEQASADNFKTLANVALLREVLKGVDTALNSSEPSAPEFGANASRIKDLYPEVGCQRLTSVRAVGVQLDRWADYSGINSVFLKAAMAALVVSGALALTGNENDLVFLTLSHVIAGGIICEVSVTADMFGPKDLLNAAAVVKSGSTSYALTLGDFIEQQQSRCQVTIIRLRGINRAPPESLLPELIELADGTVEKTISWIDKAGVMRICRTKSPIVFFLEFFWGRSVFPCVAPIAWSIPVLDSSLLQLASNRRNENLPVSTTSVDPVLLIPRTPIEDEGNDETLKPLQAIARSHAKKMIDMCCDMGIEKNVSIVASFLFFALGRLNEQSTKKMLEQNSELFGDRLSQSLIDLGKKLGLQIFGTNLEEQE